MNRSAEDIRIKLGAPDFASINTWRATPGGSANLAIARENAEEAAQNPTYAARYGPCDELISPHEYERLMQADATDVGHAPIP